MSSLHTPPASASACSMANCRVQGSQWACRQVRPAREVPGEKLSLLTPHRAAARWAAGLKPLVLYLVSQQLPRGVIH